MAGSLDALLATANGIILGEGVAQQAGVGMDDLLSVVSPAGAVLKMKVVGIFRTGITAIDNFESYALLKKAQVLQDRPNVVNQHALRLADVNRRRRRRRASRALSATAPKRGRKQFRTSWAFS